MMTAQPTTHRRALKALVALALLAVFCAPAAAQAKVKVVATTADLAALAREVGGEHVQVTSMTRPAQDAHYVDARPSYIVKLNRADLLVHNGLELEVGWLPNLVQRARNPKIQLGATGNLNASTVIKALQVPVGRVDRSQGDIHPGGNPHFLTDPSRAAKVVVAIGRRLSLTDSKNAATYAKNAKRLAASLNAFHAAERARFAKLSQKQRQVVPYHQSTIYMTTWLNLREVIHIEPRPGIPPNPNHVAKVLITMRQLGAHVVMQEVYYPRKTSTRLAKLAKGTLVVLPGGAGPNETYLARMKRTTKALYDALAAQK